MDPSNTHYQILVSQLDRQSARAGLLLRALRIFYAALGSFSAAALLSIVGSVLSVYSRQWAYEAAAVAALLVGAFGVACLVTACALMVRETRIAVQIMEEDAETVRTRFPLAH